MKDFYDICIIGGGASGLTCAVMMRNNPDKSVLLIEKEDKPGEKILASGNGRCNITNENAENYREVKDFLQSLGIVLFTEDEGRIYPYSEDSHSIVSAFALSIPKNVEIMVKSEVITVEKTCTSCFIVKLKSGKEVMCDKLVIATGGKSYPEFGTTGDGYIFAKNFGHTITPLIPGLTPINVKQNITFLKGIRAKAKVTLLKDGKPVATEYGEVQFKENSLSGICIMNLSNYVRRDGTYSLSLDLYPEGNYDGKSNRLNTILREKLAKYLVATKSDIHDLRFDVTGLGGWKEAQITCGGVPARDVYDTGESKITKGLYILGEVLDYQAKCGGYNLSHAIYTGIKAGRDLTK